jgi:hypothetical protein
VTIDEAIAIIAEVDRETYEPDLMGKLNAVEDWLRSLAFVVPADCGRSGGSR